MQNAQQLSPDNTPCSMSRDESLIHVLNAVKAGDYTIVPEGNDDVSLALKSLILKLNISTQEEMNRTVDISVQANETAIFSAHMLTSLRNVDERAQGIAAAAEQMVATVNEIGSYGQNIADQAQEAQNVTQLGAEASKLAVSGMDRIAQSVNESAEKVTVLNEFSEQIGKISGDIKKIGDLTKLLALNATIEAASAGAAGKGFAVIASEIKLLAEQTNKSTAEINTIIFDLRQESKNILAAMDDSMQAVTSGQEAIENVGARMGEIREKISVVSENSTQIASTLAEQKQASGDVAHGITQIAQSSSSSVEGIEKIVGAMDAVEKLISAQIGKLAELDVPNKVIKLAKSDHVIWKKRLANMVIGRDGLNANELADHHTCRLGKWYDTVTEAKYLNNPVYRQLVEPHKLVHDHGIRAVELFNQGNMSAALKEIEHVEAASVDVLRMLGELER